jgi:ribonuclease P protein component
MRFYHQQHLRTAADFARIRASGTRRECGFFWLLFLAGDELSTKPPRLGVIASRRIGNAVVRNRAKRRLRALFRMHQASLPPGCDLLLIARRSLPKASFADLERRFLGALKALSLEEVSS